MPSPRVRLTDAVQQSIVAYVRAGGFAEVAAEAAGVRRVTFLGWMRKGDDPKAKPRYRAFAEAVRQAQAQARLGAEVSARNDKPLDWLRNGPGRETAEQRGWTSNARPATGKGTGAALLQAEVRELVGRVLSALESHPEVRAALAEQLAGQRSEGPTTPARPS